MKHLAQCLRPSKFLESISYFYHVFLTLSELCSQPPFMHLGRKMHFYKFIYQ